MQFDVYKWVEIDPNQEIQTSSGRVRLMCSQWANLFLTQDGLEVMADCGQKMDVRSNAENLTFRVDAKKDCRVFLYAPDPESIMPVGPVFTNMDRMPIDGDATLEIKKAVRQLKIEQLQTLRALRAERHAFQRDQAAFAKRRMEPAPPPGDLPHAEDDPEVTETD